MNVLPSSNGNQCHLEVCKSMIKWASPEDVAVPSGQIQKSTKPSLVSRNTNFKLAFCLLSRTVRYMKLQTWHQQKYRVTKSAYATQNMTVLPKHEVWLESKRLRVSVQDGGSLRPLPRTKQRISTTQKLICNYNKHIRGFKCKHCHMISS
jgi:hypothetical protein